MKTLQDFLASRGNPNHFIADGDNGTKILVIEDKSSLSPGITVYPFREFENTDGSASLSLNNGWGIREEYLPAIKGFLNKFN